MEQEAPDELVGAERHGAVSRLPVAAVILVAEGHTALVESNEPAVRDRDTMSVAGEIGEHRLMRGEGFVSTQSLDLAKERQPAGGMGVGERGQKEPAEQTGQYAHWQEEAGLAAHPPGAVE